MTDWTPAIAFARLVEAADIEWRMPRARLGPQAAPGFWPSYVHSYADMAQWGTKRLEEERVMRSKRLHPSAAEISRWEEVTFDWMKRMMPEGDRTLFRGYVKCILNGDTFGDWCDRRGLSRSTAYNRIKTGRERLAATLCRNNVFLHMPDMDRVGQLLGLKGMKSLGLEEPRAALIAA
ncbi:hypothetical protein [Hansschlegelia sp.]|uniref:hypothetical protein n=1 Tax=Hansschlegelia sp. TaxID=2041892 RepID=UPI002B707687|nr:hypothetical protein [Hansschlegelia sp.]HVI27514.1 hypothetical protein [Hansschlegelia sp.]